MTARLAETLFGEVGDAIVVTRAAEMTGEWRATTVYVNEAFRALTGYAAHEVIGAPIDLWSSPGPNQERHGPFRVPMAAGQEADGALLLLTKGGRRTWAHSTVKPVVDEGGFRYFAAVIRDVERDHEVALALAEREEQLREAQAVAQIGSWAWDLRTNEVTWSEELYAIFHVEPADYETRYEAFMNRVHPDDREFVQSTHAGTRVSLEGFVMDYRIVAPDGETRWLHGRGRVLRDADGDPARLVGTCQDVTDRKQAEELLRHQALHDELTGLPTRTLLFDRLEHALSRAQRHGLLMVVLFADLDHFKAVNDRYGHTAGDEALIAIATELRTALRPGDTVARYGGDEFVAVCEEVVDDAQALHLGRRIVDAVHQATSQFELGVSASVGIVVNDGAQPAELVLRHADAAMYRAKQRGSGQIELSAKVR